MPLKSRDRCLIFLLSIRFYFTNKQAITTFLPGEGPASKVNKMIFNYYPTMFIKTAKREYLEGVVRLCRIDYIYIFMCETVDYCTVPELEMPNRYSARPKS